MLTNIFASVWLHRVYIFDHVPITINYERVPSITRKEYHAKDCDWDDTEDVFIS